MLEASSARWYPLVRAAVFGVWVVRRCWVRLVAIAEKIARPRALPICLAAVSSAAASPAWCAGTPALAAMVTPTNTAPAPSGIVSRPGSTSLSVGAVHRDAGEPVDADGGDQRAADDHRPGSDPGDQLGAMPAEIANAAVTGR